MSPCVTIFIKPEWFFFTRQKSVKYLKKYIVYEQKTLDCNLQLLRSYKNYTNTCILTLMCISWPHLHYKTVKQNRIACETD